MGAHQATVPHQPDDIRQSVRVVRQMQLAQSIRRRLPFGFGQIVHFHHVIRTDHGIGQMPGLARIRKDRNNFAL